MDYEQSIKNYLIVRDFILPWNCEYIFFKFENEKEFQVEFYDKKYIEDIHQHIYRSRQLEVPYARITYSENGCEEFCFLFKEIYIVYNLTLGQTEDFYIPDPVNIFRVRHQFAGLFDLLKKN